MKQPKNAPLSATKTWKRQAKDSHPEPKWSTAFPGFGLLTFVREYTSVDFSH